ncbi:DUF2911 domain-containing protein [Flavobacterium sp. CYK-4]|uniref:DUF2911 domain-containing protein n=1 Tax=Flavobacterium lotistagni TaxID=2709660 RepID=UPI00140DC559|nr:DUF2911 domain-containing protein [Flavobacterium lotistagni]NHM07393.1 DUF2911 domain-containing protein [Flavobacterium lotistagni]
MKKIILALVVACTALNVSAQVKTPAPSPKSTLTQMVGLTEVTVEYSRPSKKGRTVFGDLVPYGKLWRTGANQNTMVTFSDDVVINGQTLKKGKYALFTTPKVDMWEVIFYTDTDNWGTPENWNVNKVALSTNVDAKMLNNVVETLTIGVNGLDNNFGYLELSWDKTLVSLKFEVPTQKTAMASIEKVMAGPTSGDYFASAQYFYQSNGDLNKALEYVNKAIDMNKDKPFWYTRQKSLIQAKLGDKKGAIETAKISLAAATAAKNDDYVKMNNDSIAEWSKK